jgi:hypothetical protein
LEDAGVGTARSYQQAAVGQTPGGFRHQLQGGDIEEVQVLQEDEDGAVLVDESRKHKHQELLQSYYKMNCQQLEISMKNREIKTIQYTTIKI